MNKSVIFRAKPYKSQIYHPGDKRYSAVTERLNLTTKKIFLKKYNVLEKTKNIPLNQIVLKRFFIRVHTFEFHSPKQVIIRTKNMCKLWNKRFPRLKLNSTYYEKFTLSRFT